MKVNFLSQIQMLDNLNNCSQWNGNIFGLNQKDEVFDQEFYKSEQVTDVLNEPLPSGYWKTNHFIEEEVSKPQEQNLPLHHITSFEENIMKAHGERLRESFNNFLKSVQKVNLDEDQIQALSKMKIQSEQALEEAILTLSCLDEQIKLSLIEHSKKTECHHIIKNIFEQISEPFLLEALTMCDSILSEHKSQQLLFLDASELECYLSSSYEQTAHSISQKLSESQLVMLSHHQNHEFKHLVYEWMKVIYHILNGIYEDSENRVSTFVRDISNQKARKMVKML